MKILENTKNKYLIALAIIVLGMILFKIYNSNKADKFLIENNNFEENIVEIQNETKQEKKEEIVVHVAGEVKKPGIVILNKGERVIDAINAAGGKTEEADYSNINLASMLDDGQKVYIPNINDKEENSTNSNEETKDGIININKAGVQELEGLPGIGNSIARSIVEYRNENGAFKSKEDIQNVTGIGEQKYKKIQKYIEI